MQSAQSELEAERKADGQRIANQAEQQREQQQRANGLPPWQAELDDYEAVRQASMVSAPVSRSADSYSYTGPSVRPESVKLSAEPHDLCRKIGCDPVDYARQMLRMNEMIKRGDLQR